MEAFTRNYYDHSSEAGFQFEFYCDHCGNGFKSTFKEASTYNVRKKGDALSRGAGLLGGLLGGVAGDVGHVVEHGLGGISGNIDTGSPQWHREHEIAFNEAQAEAEKHFRKCPGCSAWVCSDCWNANEGLCTQCAPREAAYVAQARNQAMRNNIDEAVENATVWHGKLDYQTTTCPNCGKPAGDGAFCNHCGSPLSQSKCPQCGKAVAPGSAFCNHCGASMTVPGNGKCPQCGAENAPGSAFCSGCGSRLS